MVTSPGVLRTFGGYFRELGVALHEVGLPLLVSCAPVLLLTGVSPGRPFAYVVLSFTGMLVYYSQLHLADDLTSTDAMTDSPVLEWVAVVLLVVYYNAVLFVGTVVGLGLALEGSPALGVVVAALYPAYDAEVARLYAPISIMGAFVFTVGVLASVLLAVERLAGIDVSRDDLETLRELWGTSETVEAALGEGYNQFRRRLRPG